MKEEEPLYVDGGKGRRGSGSWWRVLLIVFLFYVMGIVVLILTGNPNIFPTVVILGNCMVPASYVAFFYERRHLSSLTMPMTTMSFFYGGVLSIFTAALFEPFLIADLNFFTAFEAGLIEEFAKILGVWVIARRWRHDSALDGLILGAAAGMGFAAMESTGYAFTAFLRSHGNLSVTVAITLLRGILSPLGHGTWTAIVAGVLFRESEAQHFRLNRKVIGALSVVVILHGLWDGLPGLISSLTLSGANILIGNSVVGAIGLFLLWRLWKEARMVQLSRLLPPGP